jgi:PAS domain S-box-containing protein
MHAGNMSPLYLAEIDGFILGKDAPACGLSVPAGQPRLTADVFEDPLWEPCLHLARKYDYRACWSFPIKTKDQNVVGTFAMYFHQPRPATEQDIALADVATRTAAMVIASYEETHQKEIAKEALLKSEERMRVTLESATDYAIITLNRERMIESWSSGASLLFGYTEAEIIGRSADIIFTKEDRAAGVPEKEMITAKETGRAADNRWHLRKDGSRFFVNGMMCPIYDQVQRLSGYVKVASDMTQQQLFTEELHRLVSERTTELQRSNEDLMQFAHVASHDMKEPARKIQTFANRILNEFGDTMPDKMRTYLDKIGSATNRMYNMINGVLNYSKISNPGQLIEMVDLNLVISEIMTDLEVLIQQKQAQISSKELPEIPGYKLLLYQLFYNLILNALKFAKAGEPAHIEITCRIVQKDKSRFYQVDVADNGIGFEQEYAASIFETFTRLNSADEYEGTGLGLALCRRIVDRHHGFISATGQPGKGAVFTILLPENEPPVKAGT